MAKIRVLLADDHAAFSDCIREILEPEVDWVGVATDADSLVAMAKELAPDIVLLDVHFSGRSGFDLARDVRLLLPAVRIVMLAVHGEPAYVEEAFRIGAQGYVIKSAARSEIPAVVRAVRVGCNYVSPTLSAGDLFRRT